MADYNSLYLTDAGIYVSSAEVYHDSLELHFDGTSCSPSVYICMFTGVTQIPLFDTIHYSGNFLRYKPAVAGPTHAVAITINNSDSFVAEYR